MIRVIAAVIEQDKKILICRRKHRDGSAGQWEFPGGKLEAGETEAQCLMRELKEELCLSVRPGAKCAEVRHDYGDFFVEVVFYRADITGGKMKLNVHEEAVWAEKETLVHYDFLAADVEFVKQLSENR